LLRNWFEHSAGCRRALGGLFTLNQAAYVLLRRRSGWLDGASKRDPAPLLPTDQQ
jgi:hypothetical protein